MGFFTSTSSTDQTQSYNNATLGDYTSAYRGFAPWEFATLDPTTTLAAMGEGTKLGGKNLGFDFKKSLQGMSDEEKNQATMANDALKRVADRQKSGQFLTPEETTFVNQQLDKSFESSRAFAYKDWEKGTQMLAGSRGLRMSDTPVAQPAMQSLRDMELGFSSQRAAQGLQTTMQLSQNQNQFDQSLASSLQQLQLNKFNTRQQAMFGSGLQGAANINYTTNTKTNSSATPSGFSQMNQMFGFAKDLGGSIASMGMGK